MTIGAGAFMLRPMESVLAMEQLGDHIADPEHDTLIAVSDMNLRHLEWLTGEPLPDQEMILYEILPYTRVQANEIIQHLCTLAGFDLGQTKDDPASAERIRQAFRLIVGAAHARQSQLDLDELERDVGRPSWRDRLQDLRDDRHRFATAIGDKSTRCALRRALIDIGQASRAGHRWLHYLRDHPDVLRRTIDRALAARILYDDPGRRNWFDRVVFAEGVGRAYKVVTGKPLPIFDSGFW